MSIVVVGQVKPVCEPRDKFTLFAAGVACGAGRTPATGCVVRGRSGSSHCHAACSVGAQGRLGVRLHWEGRVSGIVW